MPLFRSEVLEHRGTKAIGEILVSQPLSFSVIAVVSIAFSFCVLLLFAIGSYTKRSTVSGQIVAGHGTARVYPNGAGIVQATYVREGQHVKQGDLLFTLSSERESGRSGSSLATITDDIRQRQHSLEDEVTKTKTLQTGERAALESKAQSLSLELHSLYEQITRQQRRVEIATASVDRFKELVSQHFVSPAQIQDKEQDLLDQQLRLEALQRNRITTLQTLDSANSSLSMLPARQANELAVLTRQIDLAHQELQQSELSRQTNVVAPCDGTATAVLVDPGQFAAPDKALVTIVPSNSILGAELYAPSRAMGFVKIGDRVLVRYQAFPYQKFGSYTGEVESISRTALSNKDIGDGFREQSDATETFYLIRVRLESQAVHAYGSPVQLQSGMRLDADIFQETRRLYEWVLEPLYTISGRI
jgi:membrane fusion protein